MRWGSSGLGGARGPSVNARDSRGVQRPWVPDQRHAFAGLGEVRGSSINARDQDGLQRPWFSDPLRDRSADWVGGGYMRRGYDSGR